MNAFSFKSLTSLAALAFLLPFTLQARIEPGSATLFLDFAEGVVVPRPSAAQAPDTVPGLKLVNGARLAQTPAGLALEFTSALQYAELEKTPSFDGIDAMSIGGWFFPRRTAEQCFFFRGLPDIGALGERFFRPADGWVNFVLGTDQHGFLLGTINGNGGMPFAHVTVQEVSFDAWNQLVLVKDTRGFQKFYLNGALVHTDEHATGAGKVHPFHDRAAGDPIRLAMPAGGLISQAWAFPSELSPEEIRDDYLRNRDRLRPALPGQPVALREMDSHPTTGLWNEEMTASNWPALREQLVRTATELLGKAPGEKVPLEPQTLSEEDCGRYLRRKISIQVQANDRMPAYLLIPKHAAGADRSRSGHRSPAILCFYGTTSGAGKDTTVGLSGRTPGTAPERNAAFAIDMAEAGFVAMAPDYLRDGERIKPGRRPYDTTDFYSQFPDWTIHGKDLWDTSRAIDYLQTLEFVDPDRIGMVGHSYGGHSTVFITALEPRIKVAVANGPVSDFLHHGLHWGVPKGAGNSQSMPTLRPYVLDHTRPVPITFYQFTALIAPRPLLVGQAAGERRPMEEENYAAVRQVYDGLGFPGRVHYHWYAGDHDFPPEAREAAVAWFQRWFEANP